MSQNIQRQIDETMHDEFFANACVLCQQIVQTRGDTDNVRIVEMLNHLMVCQPAKTLGVTDILGYAAAYLLKR